MIFKQLHKIIDPHVPPRLHPFWNHPAGPKTIFFWAPLFKWGLVVAGLSDLQRPVEHLSTQQSLALAVTGSIWCRYSTVIIPKNWSLFSVNFFVALTGIYALSRISRHEVSKRKPGREDK